MGFITPVLILYIRSLTNVLHIKYQCIEHKECGKEFIGCQLKLPQQHFARHGLVFTACIPVTAYIAIVVAGKSLSNSVYTPPPRRRAPLEGYSIRILEAKKKAWSTNQEGSWWVYEDHFDSLLMNLMMKQMSKIIIVFM